jgi:hypothetical protein
MTLYNSTLDHISEYFLWYHGKVIFKFGFLLLTRAAGPQLLPVGILFYPLHNRGSYYFKYGLALVGVWLLVYFVMHGGTSVTAVTNGTPTSQLQKYRRFASS